MDNLNYTYDGNQLTKVKDTGKKQYGFIDGADTDQEYRYDLNGNMIADANKGISKIYYNHLNLPTKIEFETKRSVIHYTYDANGSKLKKEVARYGLPSKFTEYAGNYIYENNKLQFFNHTEGYATPNNLGKFDYIYQYKDHLGNVRLSYTKNPNSKKTTVFTDGFESMSTWDRSANNFGHSLTALDTSKKKSGSYSGRIDDNYPRQWSKYVYSDTWIPINNSEDTYYTVSGWVYVEDVTTNGYLPNLAKLWIVTRKQGERGYPTGHISTSSTKEGTWEYLSKTVLVPADVKEINVRIENARLGKVWFDDVKIVKGNTSQTVIVEESNYYPFGLKHKGYNNVISSNGNSTAQKMGFGGKELNEELGLEWHDFGARNYDASLGRWMNLDPLAEQMRRHSPYNYAFDNPIYFIDPDGMAPMSFANDYDREPEPKPWPWHNYENPLSVASTVVDSTGKIIDYKDDGDDNIYLYDRQGIVVGTERDDTTYTPGNSIVQEDLNEGYVLYNGQLAIQITCPAGVIGGAGILELIGPGGLLKLKSVVSFFKGFSLWRSTRVVAGSLKELKFLIKQLSKPGSELTKKELKQLEKLVIKFGGKLRKDLNPVKGKINKPHVQVEGLGKSIESRHIWLKSGVK